MVLPELTTYVNSQIPTWVPSTNLFYGLVPPDPDVVLVLLEYSGLPNEPDLGTGDTRLVFPNITVLARGVKDDYVTPRQNLQDIVTLFTKVVNTTIGGIPYKAIEAKGEPAPLRRDENFRVECVVSFKVTKGYSAT